MCSLYLFDVMGSFTGIRIKGHHRIQSNLGGFLSLFGFIIAMIAVCFFWKHVYFKIRNFPNTQCFKILEFSEHDNKRRFEICSKQ